ncbi:hypothetical protein [Gimesia fumaroli]|uniref:Uncharacterized protein n=1 Tax=Gimesia fumaroli TaxID=2527976 RepID=A0A518IKW8_9PLAN|nr:hypothetical protein [Gimesia fumaroli]QDV53724.1 hypothetical protein Enr17x_58050 [Gimesia fumaroli]
MSQAEEQIIQTDLDQLEVIGEEVASLGTDMSFGMQDRIETICQAIRNLTRIKKHLLYLAQH